METSIATPTTVKNWGPKLFKALLLATTLLFGHPPTGLQAQSFSVVHSFGILTNVVGFYPQAPLVQGPDDTLYGTTTTNELQGFGSIFKLNPDGTGLMALKLFTNVIDGANPSGSLLLDGTTLYGTTAIGGSAGLGNIFKINTDGSGFNVLKTFASSSTDGANPTGGLILSGGILYGTATAGGSAGSGTVFAIHTDGTGFQLLKSFGSSAGDALGPLAGLAISGATLYGTTPSGGAGSSAIGTIFKINTDGSSFALLKTFSNGSFDGYAPLAGLLLSGATLYGTTTAGGTYQFGAGELGTLFKINTDGTGFQVLANFPGYAYSVQSALILGGNTLYGTATAGSSSTDVGAVFSIETDGNNFTFLKTFANGKTDGATPSGLILNSGKLFGTTYRGGGAGNGTIFELNTDGSGSALLASFGYSDAVFPTQALLANGNVLYGTTGLGGPSQNGTVFKINPDGTDFQVLHGFAPAVGTVNSDGITPQPAGRLVINGNTLYGTAYQGGLGGNGTIFAVNVDGTGFTVLKHFVDPAADGANPIGGLTLVGATLYGTTQGDSQMVAGTVFKINTDGTGFAQLANLQGFAGALLVGSLVPIGNSLFGVDYFGGDHGAGAIFKVDKNGSPFLPVWSFGSTTSDGQVPRGGLLLVGDTFYGTTFTGGGSPGNGTVYKIKTDGTGYAVLKRFPQLDSSGSNADGAFPTAGLVANADGSKLYGTADQGGTFGKGTVYQINTDGTGFSVIYSFSASENGFNSEIEFPPLALTLNGNTLYGTSSNGGNLDEGTIFALALPAYPILRIQQSGNSVVLTWTNSAFGLQSAPILPGTFTNVPSAASSYTNPINGTQQFFRLMGK